MIFLDKIGFDFEKCRKELVQFEKLLKNNKFLEESKDISNLFKKNRNLAALFAKLEGRGRPTHLSFEVRIKDEYKCDVVVGVKDTGVLTFVEFEPAKKYSMFKMAPKVAPYWGHDLEHGFSQISDWFYSIRDIETKENEKLEFKVKDYVAFLIVGRDSSIESSQYKKNRLEWRTKNIRVNGRKIVIMTYDQLYIAFLSILDEIEDIANRSKKK